MYMHVALQLQVPAQHINELLDEQERRGERLASQQVSLSSESFIIPPRTRLCYRSTKLRTPPSQAEEYRPEEHLPIGEPGLVILNNNMDEVDEPMLPANANKRGAKRIPSQQRMEQCDSGNEGTDVDSPQRSQEQGKMEVDKEEPPNPHQ